MFFGKLTALTFGKPGTTLIVESYLGVKYSINLYISPTYYLEEEEELGPSE